MDDRPAAAVTAVIVNHNDWPGVRRQLEAWATCPKALSPLVDWRILDNSDPTNGDALSAKHDDDRRAGIVNAESSQVSLVPRLTDYPQAVGLSDAALRLAAQVRVQRTANRGYGAAINHVALETDSPWILALNADLVPEPGFLDAVEQLLRAGTAEPNPPAVRGARLLDEDGTPQGTAGRFPTLLSTLTGLFRPRRGRKYLSLPSDHATDVSWVTGACMLLDRYALFDVGSFDEAFFMYYEDVDLCLRLHQAGRRVTYEPSLAARHLHPYHSRQLTIPMVCMARHGLLRWFRLHRPRWEFRLLGWIMRAECRWRGMTEGWPAVDAMIRAFLADPDGFRLDPDVLPRLADKSAFMAARPFIPGRAPAVGHQLGGSDVRTGSLTEAGRDPSAETLRIAGGRREPAHAGTIV